MKRYDLEAVKMAARGYWPAILNRVAGIDDDYLSSSHGPCPNHGGKDKWRCFDDWKETGGAVCNDCGKMADGFAVIQKFCRVGFIESVRMVAEFLGVPPSDSHKGTSQSEPSKKKHTLEWQPWNEMVAALWCQRKQLDLEQVKASGARHARYGKKKQNVIAFPLFDENGEPAGWSLYQASGGKLEHWNPKTKRTELLKMKTIKV
ncbi:primase-helicase zinc-binding domain-containing protein [Roseiconus lacunae]|uniref:primase-helicase zinc-binding domain-containing protein n=1 Tax=Roseiconus lacunae TaxID=2605694 RepID=UPI001E328316|nr:primase-helicase zinc-binding domain-containing protein [Roseiconus lacunae]MCD0459153.1 hypothetical protein [Roseiconus lacunae]